VAPGPRHGHLFDRVTTTPEAIKERMMKKAVWQAPKVETTPVSMEVTAYLPAQA
jgi:coenzyme PQQ precursor peptide PqqA